MTRYRMSQTHVLALVLVAAAFCLFLYTFTGKSEKRTLRPARPSLHPSISTYSLMPATMSRMITADFFNKQAAQRRSMFAEALNDRDPSVAKVLLPIVPEVRCPSLVRVGSVGDGGKWVCNPWAMPKGGVVFSLGSHDDISFEADFQEMTNNAANIITVDMNAASTEALEGLANINAKFVRAKIDSKTDLAVEPPHYTVEDLMANEGHASIEILKMDIEGAEITVLPQFLQSNPVCQIMVEIHQLNEQPKLLRAVADAGFLLQSYELNAKWTGTGLCEYSFIHESCLEKYGATLLASYLKQ